MLLTPAYAGNMQPDEPLDVHIKAHPRIRGEYSSLTRRSYIVSGSPPHTRGIYGARQACNRLLRLTPAYAGNIISEHFDAKADWAHPRIRGEYWS